MCRLSASAAWWPPASRLPPRLDSTLDVLRNGGNAIDTAIAANTAMGLMEPTGNGIGGDLFALIWHAESGQLYTLYASGRSPLGLNYDNLMEKLDEIGSGISLRTLQTIQIPF